MWQFLTGLITGISAVVWGFNKLNELEVELGIAKILKDKGHTDKEVDEKLKLYRVIKLNNPKNNDAAILELIK